MVTNGVDGVMVTRILITEIIIESPCHTHVARIPTHRKNPQKAGSSQQSQP